jgi:hypothetical protein
VEVLLRPETEDVRPRDGSPGFRGLDVSPAFFLGLEGVGVVPFEGDCSGGAEEAREVEGAARYEVVGLFPGVGRSSIGFSVSVMGRFWGWTSVIAVEVVVGAFGLNAGFCRENTDCFSSGRGLNTLLAMDGIALGVSAVRGLNTGWAGWMVVGFWNMGGGFVETEEEGLGGSGRGGGDWSSCGRAMGSLICSSVSRVRLLKSEVDS